MTYSSAPLSSIKSIVAATWPEFIKELKLTVGQGKQEPHRLMYQDSYFKCLLVDGKNEGFVKCLDSITGSEVNVLELIDKLMESASVKTAGTAPTNVEQQTSTETPEMYVKTEAKTNDSDVDITLLKPRTTPRKRTKKDVQQ